MKNEIIEALTVEEAVEFESLDAIIQVGAITFLEVGRALVTVHSKKLYRATHGTFLKYAESRGLKSSQAYDLMKAVQLTLKLENSVRSSGHDDDRKNIELLKGASANTVITLAKVSLKKQAKVLAAAVEATGGKLTAPAIAQAAAKEDHRATPALATVETGDTVTGNPVTPAVIAPIPVVLPKGHITPAQFQTIIDDVIARILPGEHHKFGKIADKAASRLMNWGAEQKTAWVYGE